SVQAWDGQGALANATATYGTAVVVYAEGGVMGDTIDLLVAPTAPDTCAPYTVEVTSLLPVCEDDLYEPNDVASVYADAPVALTLYDGDVDRFAVDLYPGEELFVDALFDSSWGDVDLALLDAYGAELASSTTSTDDESMVWFNDSPFVQELTIEVALWGADSTTCQDVTLDWVVYGAACWDDGLEGDDTPVGAWELVPQPGTSVIFDLVADDDDWFWLETLGGEAVDVYIEHGTYGAELDLTAYDALGTVDYAYAGYAFDEVGVQLPVTPYGDVYDLEIRPLAGPGTCLPYTLTVVSW
ncbi:MAG: hypothetical protein KC656_34750, partial [Myxococcales bacterium]|nr:hypothetical protein [Myxococcales bacterium]